MLISADFETTTDENDCRVWAWGITQIGNTDYFEKGIDLNSFLTFMEGMKGKRTVYFHNARFDCSFIITIRFDVI